jgi:hypothetical protein
MKDEEALEPARALLGKVSSKLEPWEPLARRIITGRSSRSRPGRRADPRLSAIWTTYLLLDKESLGFALCLYSAFHALILSVFDPCC